MEESSLEAYFKKSMPFTSPTFIGLISLVVFLVVWVSACKLISLLGWRDLAKRHQALLPASGVPYFAQSLDIGRFAKYKGCVTIHTSKAGIHLAVFAIFRIGHPPIFFPWSAVRLLKEQQGLLNQRFLYDLGTPRVRRIALQAEIHQAIQQHQSGIESA